MTITNLWVCLNYVPSSVVMRESLRIVLSGLCSAVYKLTTWPVKATIITAM